MIEYFFSSGLHGASSFLGTPSAIFSMICPWITKTFPSLTKLKQHKQFYLDISNKIQDLIEAHKKDLDVDNPRDFIDYFLIDMKNSEDVMDSQDVEDQEEKLRTLIIDIFGVSNTTI